MTIQVIMRYVFNSPLQWAEEASKILFIILIFFGSISAEHIHVTAFIERLNKALRQKINYFNFSLESLYFITITYLFLVHYTSSNTTYTNILEIPMYYLLAVVPVAFLLTWIKDVLLIFIKEQ